MTNPLASADFFALEAGECLDRLESLVDREVAPPGDELLRASRVLRGSALMAGQQAIARAAGGLEAVARAHRDGRRVWDPATREHLAQAVEEFRFLVRRAREWTEQDTGRASRLGLGLEALAGKTGGPEPRRDDRAELNTGVRAFVAREGALIASALERASRALQVAPEDREPLYNVIRRMQTLRGLAELGELVPLPEILDGIELAVGDLTRLYAPPPGVDEVIAAAAGALTRIARDIAEHGRPHQEAEEARRFTDLLLRAFAVERDVVPIETLFFSDDPSPVSVPPSQPAFGRPAPLGALELVSHGEHLWQTADLVGRSRSTTERDLRLYHLLGTLRSAAVPGPDPVAGALAVFARAVREALAAGAAAHAIESLVGALRSAGDLLRAVADADDRMQLSRRLLDVAHRVDELTAPAGEPRGPTVPEPAPGGADIVPIEALGYSPTDRPEPPVVSIESLAPDSARGIEASFVTLGRLLRERKPEPPSLEALLGRSDAVAIESLCYRGRAALERAAAVRLQLATALGGPAADLATIRPLLQELIDLVPLALVES